MEPTSSKFFLVFFLVETLISSSCIYSASAARNSLPKTNTEFIRTSCSATSYPKLCFSSLSIHASTIQTSPELLAGTALNVTLSSAKSTSFMMVKLSQSHGINPREVAAMKDCIEELSDSVDQLRNAIGEMSQLRRSNFDLVMNDIQTWVSAALTDENTCTDGFAGKTMNGELKIAVKGRIVNVAQLTSNALALINKYAILHG
ncbi:hypothetical protein FNV43_RR24233 [Rhamnella rubrinervis]|uniref:Pectinesterase inhibitor domain-containing protein n=1 Tax=Rhamnella rubrinervis TaxID=2594499 RepID=A0A8K0DME5_9ROSA|nr:hypothetical protein FNV43_RR24233 [Rhamnella rubrinervis]